jgi:3-oxoacyl-[acyl-carrier protein] reductase
MLLSNVAGPHLMASAVVPGMIARGFGRIVNVSTSRPTMLFAGGGAYGPSKVALEASSRIWAEELAGTGVTVNVLLPGGASDTALIPGDVGSRARPFAAGSEPPGREGFVDGLLPPEIMAPPLLWLASDASDGVTGRRFVARDWDDGLPADVAATRAESLRTEWPHIV